MLLSSKNARRLSSDILPDRSTYEKIFSQRNSPIAKSATSTLNQINLLKCFKIQKFKFAASLAFKIAFPVRYAPVIKIRSKVLPSLLSSPPPCVFLTQNLFNCDITAHEDFMRGITVYLSPIQYCLYLRALGTRIKNLKNAFQDSH